MRVSFSAFAGLTALSVAGCGARTPILLDDAPAPDAGIDADSGRAPFDARADVVGRGDTGLRDAGLDGVDGDAAGLGPILYVPASQVTGEWGGEGFARLPIDEDAAAFVSPPARDQTALASDGNEVVLFGGLLASNEYADDTWLFAGTWSMASPIGGAAPSPRGLHSMARLGSTVLLFGGQRSAATSSVLGDTWIWSGGTWTDANPAMSPSPRSLAAMAPLGGDVVLFGGSDANGNSLSDTWVWDGTTWTPVDTEVGPPAQFGITMMAPLGDVVVLFVPDMTANDMATWTFDGSSWTDHGDSPGGLSPAALVAFGATTLASSILIYGGYEAISGQPQQGSFSWDGTEWSLFSPQTLQPATVTGATPSLMATLDHP